MRCLVAGGLMIVLAAGSTPVLGAGLSGEEVDRLAAQAAQFQEARRWADAMAALENGIAACDTGDDGRPCRVQLRLRAGYLAERWSREEKDREPLLRRAAAFYEDVLKEAAGHGVALNNLALVYQRLNETPRGIALLQRELAADVGDVATLSVTLGDLLRDQKKAGDALTAYRRALADDPDALAAARRIVDLYRDLLSSRVDELLKLLEDWRRQRTLDEIVEHGYRVVMELTYVRAETQALQSLVPWVELSARRRWVSARSLEALPSGWKHPAVLDLSVYMAAPERMPSGSWWMRVGPARNALSSVALALGHERLGEGAPKDAAQLWETGVSIAPPYDEYQDRADLKGAWIVRADLQGELASLYLKTPALDPQNHKFTQLVEDLFGGKARAYAFGDRETIQGYHTVLGLLFAERKLWTSSRSYANAIFQLENAIKTAEAREKERGPQPLPELKALLAEGYGSTGRVQEARKLYALAAEAYLEIDGLDPAYKMLTSIGRHPGPPVPSAPALDVIIKSRSSIPRASQADLAAESTLRSSPEHAWIFGGAMAGLTQEFVARQRFKAMADLSARASALGEATAAARYAARALNLSVKEVGTLIGFGDVIRLRNLRRAVTDPIRLDPTMGGKISGKSWLLSVPGESSARRIEVSSEVILAGRVLDVLDHDPKVLNQNVSVTIRGSAVHLDGHDQPYLRDAATKVQRIEGVSRVNVRTRE